MALFSFNGYSQQPAANLDQVRNGAANSVNDPGNWVNGNAGSSNSHYAEGMSIPYRARLTALPAGTSVTLTLEYDVKHSSRHAIDYLTHYDRIGPHEIAYGHAAEEIDPTIGTSFTEGVGATTFAIPSPPVLNSSVPGQPTASYDVVSGAGAAYMTMWGGTITAISYPNTADLSLAQSAQKINVTFTANGGEAVLAWGGHIGSRLDWGYDGGGVPLSAGGVSGSPYHMRLIDWTLNNLGNQDRSLSADGVIPAPECTLDGPETVCEGSENGYSVTPIGAVNPTYTWELISNTSGATFVGGTPANTETETTINSGTSSGSYTVKVTISSEFGQNVCEKTVTVEQAPQADNPGPAEACDEYTLPALTNGNYFTGPGGTGTPLSAGDKINTTQT
ncbi:hypothetical protein KO566_13735, partial [Flavobacteriaceae bacterium XHP0103]|nr:hypothetical protein [Marixanthotalea marina]